jgi:phenylpropionate dioxygenase-like ring-hydroxylating dioxygenase large terminal subunit
MDKQTEDSIKAGMEYEGSRKEPPANFPPLPDIPVQRYTDPDFHQLEMKKLWQNSWLYVAHNDELPNPGDFLLFERGSAPIFLIRGNDGIVRAFFNTCRHRGAPIVEGESGNKRGLMCAYHGWTYNLEGDLINLRDKRDFVDLDMSCRSLYKVRCETYGNFIFINENSDAEPLLDYLGPFVKDFDEMQPDKLRFVERHGFEVKCNVKIFMDAFLEVYHIKSIHPNTLDPVFDHRGTHITLWENGHSRMVLPSRDESLLSFGTEGFKQIDTVGEIARTTSCTYNIFPNLTAHIDHTGAPLLTFWPIDMETTYAEIHWLTPDLDGAPLPDIWQERISTLDTVLGEDIQFMPTIQKSMQSRVFEGIPLNYQERRIYHWHEELDRRIGQENIPQSQRVEPKLGHLIETDS